MAFGDDAVAAGMAKVDGATTPANTIDDELNRTRDYIAQGKGATAANTPDTVVKRSAAGNIAISSPTNAQHAATKQYVDVQIEAQKSLTSGGAEGKVPAFNAAGQLPAGTPTSSGQAANKGYVDTSIDEMINWVEADKYAKTGGTITGQVYLPNAYAAASGPWTIAYLQADGRLAKGASSERYKDRITPIEALALGNIFPGLYEYVMRDDPDQVVRLGHIAERLNESADLRRFVVYKSEPILDQPGSIAGYRLALDDAGQPIPESIDFIGLLLAQTAQLAARITELEARQ